MLLTGKKRSKLLLMLLITGIVALSSCKKDDDDTTPAGSNGSITLKVDGTSWNASLGVQAVNTNGVINVTGSDSNAHQAAVLIRQLDETWPTGAKVPLMAAQANEANTATDETPAKAAPLCALRLAFCMRWNH